MTGKRCIITGCGNSSHKTPKKLFLTVPKRLESRRKWFQAAGKSDMRLGQAYYCCEDHFDLEKDVKNWMYYKTMGKCNFILNEHVVPRKNVPYHVPESPINDSSTTEPVDDSATKPVDNSTAEPVDVSTTEPVVDSTYIPLHMVTLVDAETQTVSSEIFAERPKSFLDAETQIVSSEIFEERPPKSFLEKVREKCPLAPLPVETNSKFYLGLPKSDYSIVQLLQTELQVRIVHILIVLKKIKLNDPFPRLAIDFGQKPKTVYTIFKQTLPRMASKMKELIFWPRKHKTVQAVIDCFQVQIEPCDVDSYKFLISCTSTGFINFVSRKFGGGVSDLNVVRGSGYMEALPKNANFLIADRGFKKIVCKDKRLSLVTGCKWGMTVRLHTIERLVCKVRDFEMVGRNTVLESEMAPFLDDVVVVICAVINLQSPLIK